MSQMRYTTEVDLVPGRSIAGRYRIERVLGEGGSGVVVLAHDTLFARPVTLKLLATRSPEGLAAFRNEFVTLLGLVHPGLPEVHDFGVARDDRGERRPFYTARYVDGMELDRFASGKRWEALVPP